MLRTVIISADRQVSRHLETLLEKIQLARFVRTVAVYPPAADVAALLRTTAPEAVILDFDPLEVALTTAHEIQAAAPGIQVIGLQSDRASQSILPILRSGARELLSPPVERNSLEAALARAQERIDELPPLYPHSGKLFCFVPAKGGVGATTLALNTAVALAEMETLRPLLVDFDLNAGMVRFLLNLQGEYRTEDALEQSGQLDGGQWKEMLANVGNLDVLHTGKRSPDRRLAHTQIRQFTGFAIRIYHRVVFDLSPHLEPYAQSALQSATRIFLVTTPELNSVHLAREKCRFLETLEFGNRLSLVLNRAQRGTTLTRAKVENLVQLPVTAEIPNKYLETQAALTAGRPVAAGTELGRAYRKFAETLSGRAEPRQAPASSPFKWPVFGMSAAKS